MVMLTKITMEDHNGTQIHTKTHRNTFTDADEHVKQRICCLYCNSFVLTC
jgi:hypothetical protein